MKTTKRTQEQLNRLIAAAPELLEFAEIVARGICLDQRIGNRCICYRCEAERLISKVKGEQ